MHHARPLICATLTASRTADLRAARDRAERCDMVELRIDSVADPDPAAALAGRRLPAVVTCRAAQQGGWFRGSEEDRRRILREALGAGAEFVDLEWRLGFDDWILARGGRGILLSHHDFAGVPPDLEDIVAAMTATPAEVVKVAVQVSRLSECLRLAALGRRYADRGIVLVGMGEAGALTRICPSRFGSRWTYAGASVAPGQFGLEQLHREFRFLRAGAGTPVYGVLGRPVSHSVSPAMHNAAFEALGVDAVYVPLAAADVGDFFEAADGLGLQGASVTAPYKEAVLPYLTAIDAAAAGIGAVNTLLRRADGWHGANTDPAGFLAGFGGPVARGTRAVILGTGGAARAAAVALRAAGCAVTCFGRDAGRARALEMGLGVRTSVRPVPPGSWDLLVNATPVGTYPEAGASPYPGGAFTGATVYDMVYNPPVTRLMREAEAAGCRAIGGIDMLVEQARLQIAGWTGRAPDAAVLRAAAHWRLSRFEDAS